MQCWYCEEFARIIAADCLNYLHCIACTGSVFTVTLALLMLCIYIAVMCSMMEQMNTKSLCSINATSAFELLRYVFQISMTDGVSITVWIVVYLYSYFYLNGVLHIQSCTLL